MIFAELQYEGHYGDQHEALVALLGQAFRQVRSGYQGDSWVWVMDGGEKVAVDTFTSLRHQVKSPRPGPHVQRVLAALQGAWALSLFDPPAWEGHEDGNAETSDPTPGGTP